MICMFFSVQGFSWFSETKKAEEIRVAIVHDVSMEELQKRPPGYSKEGKILFRGKKYVGRLDFFDNGDSTLTAVNVLPMEEYLVGLVKSEMPSDWPIEAVKAQAVAARTYALFQKKAKLDGRLGSVYDVESSVLDQVYGGSSEDVRVRKAVESTSGEILVRHGDPIKSFFNSTCGGQTELAINVWGEESLFPSIKDRYCKRSPHYSWTYSISKPALAEKLRVKGFLADDVANITIENRKSNPRAGIVMIDTGLNVFFIQGSDFREMVGYNNLKSTWFNVKIEDDKVVFEGHGYGHGVGMCQWGAKGMAEAGKNYRQILHFYYPGIKLQTPNFKSQITNKFQLSKIQ